MSVFTLDKALDAPHTFRMWNSQRWIFRILSRIGVLQRGSGELYNCSFRMRAHYYLTTRATSMLTVYTITLIVRNTYYMYGSNCKAGANNVDCHCYSTNESLTELRFQNFLRASGIFFENARNSNRLLDRSSKKISNSSNFWIVLFFKA